MENDVGTGSPVVKMSHSAFGVRVRGKRHQAWVSIGVLLVIGGVVGAVLAAGAVARNDAQTSRQAFESSSADIASTLGLAIQHEEDLVVSASAFVSGNPNASNSEFVQWANTVQAFTRYPELDGLGNSVIVPADELGAFAVQVLADPSGPLAPNGTFEIIPPGNRPYYCLSTLGASRDVSTAFPAGFDFCASKTVGPASLAARDSGQGYYTPIVNGPTKLLAVQTPIYRGGVVPGNVTARRAAFEGWLGMATVPEVLLERVLKNRPNTAVTFGFHTGSSDVAFSSGIVPRGAQSTTIDLHNGWTVKTFGTVTGSAARRSWDALAVLIAGVVLSMLFGALVFVLATGRTRALRLVRERTAQLRGAQAQLVDSARDAGRAEIATNVLHNVGNVLNSVNVSANVVAQKVRGSRAAGLSKAVGLMGEHASNLGDFLTSDPKGKALPGYLVKLDAALTAERESIEVELRRLGQGIDHIAEIVNAQQSLTGPGGVIEPVNLVDAVNDALRMAGVDNRPGMTVIRDVADVARVAIDRHRLLLILVNLITNAAFAMGNDVSRPGQLIVRAEVTNGSVVTISVTDNGEGIAAENLTRIFGHGFTTHVGGHGFGLHSSALAAKEMGGVLSVQSDGTGRGARFLLEIPAEPELVSA